MKKTAFLSITCVLLIAGTATVIFAKNQKNKEQKMEQKDKETVVLMKTSMGDMKIKLYNETPLHRDNFIKLVNEKYYDGLLFHRVIKDFMIQGGDPESKDAPAGKMLGNGGPGYTIPAEILPQIRHKKGSLAAARMGDNVNPKRESSGSQFYIVQGQVFTDMQVKQLADKTGTVYTKEQIDVYTTIGGTPHLDGAYTVFGEVIDGFDVIDKIAAVAKDRGDRPIEDVKIISISIVK